MLYVPMKLVSGFATGDALTWQSEASMVSVPSSAAMAMYVRPAAIDSASLVLFMIPIMLL